MKRFYISIALFVFVIASSIISEIYLEKLENRLITQLNAAEISYKENAETATAEIVQANNIWNNNISYLSIFINSETLDDISQSFLELIAQSRGSKNDFDSSLYSLKYKLNDLIETERLDLMSFI